MVKSGKVENISVSLIKVYKVPTNPSLGKRYDSALLNERSVKETVPGIQFNYMQEMETLLSKTNKVPGGPIEGSEVAVLS